MFAPVAGADADRNARIITERATYERRWRLGVRDMTVDLPIILG